MENEDVFSMVSNMKRQNQERNTVRESEGEDTPAKRKKVK